MKCGKPLRDETKYICQDCIMHEHAYDRGRAVYVYDSYIKRSIYLYKYGGRKEYGVFFGQSMAKVLKEWLISIKPDGIVPIPLHAKRFKERGYNQAAVMARSLGKASGIPVYDGYLKRNISTKAQKNLSRTKRQNNLKNAFIIGSNDVKLNTAILIDDIYTTGATIDSAAKCLRENGTSKVYYVVLSIGNTN